MANRFAIDGWWGAKIKYSSFPAIVNELIREGHEPGPYTWPVKNPGASARSRPSATGCLPLADRTASTVAEPAQCLWHV